MLLPKKRPPMVPTPPPGADELPCDDGQPMETYRHFQQMSILILSLEQAWKDRDDFFVGGNMFLYYSELQVKQNDFRGPDVFVVKNTERRERRSWVVWEENGLTPDVIIELLSDSTEQVDRGEKMQIYSRALRVGEYFLFDPFTGLLEGYILDIATNSYRPLLPGPDGTFECTQLGLRLGIVESTWGSTHAPWLRWLDDDGNVLLTPPELAEQETRRADAQTRLAQEEAKRAEEEAKRAEEEAKRAEEEAKRAEEEAKRADRLAARLARYEELYGSIPD